MFQFILNLLHRRAGRFLREGGRVAPEKIAAEAVTMAVGNCGKIHTDPKWREYIAYDKMPEAEQDRALNEILCTTLVTVYAGLDETIPFLPGDRRDFWRQVRDAFYPSFQKWQQESNIPNRGEWKKLFEFRLKEYENSQKETYDQFRDQIAGLHSENDRCATVRALTLMAQGMTNISQGRRLPTDKEATQFLHKHLSYLVKENWRRFGW